MINRMAREQSRGELLTRSRQSAQGQRFAHTTIAQVGAKATDVLDTDTRAVDETTETLPELEDENFTIDTTGW